MGYVSPRRLESVLQGVSGLVQVSLVGLLGFVRLFTHEFDCAAVGCWLVPVGSLRAAENMVIERFQRIITLGRLRFILTNERQSKKANKKSQGWADGILLNLVRTAIIWESVFLKTLSIYPQNSMSADVSCSCNRSCTR